MRLLLALPWTRGPVDPETWPRTVPPAEITDTCRGFSQGRLPVLAGQAYNGYLWPKLPHSNALSRADPAALEQDNTAAPGAVPSGNRVVARDAPLQ